MTSNGHNGIQGHSGYSQMTHKARLDGKVALVTGSGRGLGTGIAVELGSRGTPVVANYAKSASAAEKVVADIESFGSKAIAIQADVSKTPEVSKLFNEALVHFGRLDIVVSNSGMETF